MGTRTFKMLHEDFPVSVCNSHCSDIYLFRLYIYTTGVTFSSMTRKVLRRTLSLNTLALIAPLAFFLSFAVLSCDNDDGSPEESGPRVGIVYDSVGKGDGSFNDSAYEGIKRAQGELGAVVSEETTDGMESNREDLIQSLAENNDLVIAVGFSFEDSIKKVAAANPDTNFAGIDILQRNNSPANFASLVFNEAEGSFLVGVAAALKSKTGKVGFIGGVCGTPDRLIEKFEAGFVSGVLAMVKGINRNMEVETVYLSQFSDPQNPDGPPDISGFFNPEGAKEAAEGIFSGGSDVVFHAAGGSGAGLFEAAREFSSQENNSKVWAIGVDSDQYGTSEESVRKYILTSMLKRVDTAVYNIIKAQRDGEFSGGSVNHDLANDGVGYATSGGFVDNIRELIEGQKAFIVRNLFDVPTAPVKGCREPQTYNLRY